VASKAILASSAILNLFMSIAITQIWEMINSLQVIVGLLFFNTFMPANSKLFFSFIIDMTEFEVLPSALIFEDAFPFLIQDEEIEGEEVEDSRLLKAKEKKKDSKSKDSDEEEGGGMIEKVGTIFLIGIAIILLIPIFILLRIFRGLHPTIRAYHD
jgi:hypothetical protein